MPSWTTRNVNVCDPPCTVIVLMRNELLGFAPAENVTLWVPVPLPPAGDPIVIQESPSETVQAHPVAVLTVKLPDPLPAPKDCVKDERE